MSVIVLFDLIRPFRRLDDVLPDCVRQDFVGARTYSNTPIDDPECVYCRLRLFRLKDERGIRLGRPALGRYDVGG